jgi:hypothetical protein
MGITLGKLAGFLRGELDIIPASSLRDRINDALQEIYDEAEWGFLFADSFIRLPARIDGTASVFKYGRTIRVDAATAAKISAITFDDGVITERQVRIKGTTQIDRGFVYNILAYGNTNGVQATGNIQIANPGVGDTVTINGIVFTFTDDPQYTNDVLIDPGFINAITAQNLVQSIIAYDDPATRLASYILAPGATINIVYISNGTVGNGFTLAGTAARIIVSGAHLTGGVNDTIGEITIDPPYQDVTNPNVNIEIVKIYYKPPYFSTTSMQDDGTGTFVPVSSEPIIDFKRFEYVVSPLWNRRMILDGTQAEIYKFDPYREFAAEPRYIIPFGTDTENNPLYEIYPAPSQERVLRVKYLRNGLPLVRDSDQAPDIFTKNFIIEKAKIKSYEWVMANAEKLNIKSPSRFGNMIVLAQKRYDVLLEEAKKKDEERAAKAYQGNVFEMPFFDRIDPYMQHMGETLVLNF